MTERVSVTFTSAQVRVLEILINLAITQWPISMMDIDEDLLALQTKMFQAANELDR